MPYINLEVGKSKPQRVLQIGGMWSNKDNERGIIEFIHPVHYGDELFLHVKVKYENEIADYIVCNYYESKKVPLSEIYSQ